MQKLNYIDYASATAVALVMLIISFLILLIINIMTDEAGKAYNVEKMEVKYERE